MTLTTLGDKLRLGFTTVDNFGDLPQGRFIQRLRQAEIVYSFNPDLSVATTFQYASTVSRVAFNARLRWIIKPGKELFVVWNRGINPAIGSTEGEAFPTGDEVIVKLNWGVNW